MLVKAGQIIAIDSVKVDPTLSGDGVNSPLGVKAVAPTVSGHAGLSAEKVDNTVYIGIEPDAVKVVSTNESVSIEKIVKSDGTVEYNLGVSVEPVVSDTKIIGTNGISARETAPATYTIGVSGDYVKSETLNDYYTSDDVDNLLDNYALSADVNTAIAENEVSIKDWANDEFQEKGDYAENSDIDSLSSTVNAYFQKKGKYVTSAENPEFEGKALVLKDNKWEEAPEGTVYTSGPNIKIDGTSISGRDWSPELAEKANMSDLKGLATQDDLDALSDAIATNLAEALDETSAWAKSEFQPKSEMSAYYTKSEVDDLIDDYALSADVNTAIAKNEATVKTWAEGTFQKKGSYASATDITSLSSTVDTKLADKADKSYVDETFQVKGNYVTSADNTLSGKALVLKDNKWEKAPEGTTYTQGPNIDIHGTVISGRDWTPELNDVKEDIADLNAAVAEEFRSTSAWANETFQPVGEYLIDEDLENYYTKSEVDGKVEELANEFDSIIDSVSATVDRDFALKTELEGKLDKSETTNWDVKEYSASDYITIQNHKISGKDWSTEIGAKQDKLSDKQLSAISSVSAIEAMSGKWVTSGVDVISGDYYYGLVNKNGTVEWEPIPKPDYPDIVGNNGISAEFDVDKWGIGIDTRNIAANKQYAFTTSGWKEVTAQGTITAGTDLVLENGVMKVNTNGVTNAAGMAFVEGIDTVASGTASHAEGKETSAFGDYSHVGGYRNKDFKIEGLIGANHVEGAYNQTSAVYSHVEGHANTLYGYGVHMQGGYNEFYSHNLSADKSNPEERWNIWGQSIEGMANKTTTEPTSGTPGEPDFGYVHGGILKVIGNGTRTKTNDSDPESEVIARSDALILYRDGSMWVQGPISANGVELGGGTSYQGRNGVNVVGDYIELTQTAYNAVTSVSSKVDKPDTTQTEFNNKYLGYSTLSGQGQTTGWIDLGINFYSKSEANGTFVNKTTYNADKATFLTTAKAFVSGTNFDTLGQSRLDSNNTCLGTNWMGVSVSHAGFFKFIDGQNPGDTYIDNAGSGIQVEFKPDRTQGELNIINTYAGTETTTKVINVPAASYTNMSTFDSENGPNYMLRKTANGFDIGAAVINTTELPANVQANAYYFIYEM